VIAQANPRRKSPQCPQKLRVNNATPPLGCGKISASLVSIAASEIGGPGHHPLLMPTAGTRREQSRRVSGYYGKRGDTEDWELRLAPPVNRVLPIARARLGSLWKAY
jgi:hypothetical protein